MIGEIMGPVMDLIKSKKSKKGGKKEAAKQKQAEQQQEQKQKDGGGLQIDSVKHAKDMMKLVQSMKSGGAGLL